MASSTSPATLSQAHHFISLKLTPKNFLHWKAQIEPFLQSHHLLGYGTGAIPRPSTTTADSPLPTSVDSSDHSGIISPAPATPTLTADAWDQQDALLRSLLVSSISDEVFPVIVGKTSSHDIWTALHTAHLTQVPPVSTFTEAAPPSPWFPDTGATHHVTPDPTAFTSYAPYSGTEQVHVGGGQPLPIAHTGRSLLSTPGRSFHLNEMLHVPSLSRPLLSVQKFAQDNGVFFEFHPHSFYVKDPRTRRTLLSGTSKDGLYCTAAPSPSSPRLHLAERTLSQSSPYELLHRRPPSYLSLRTLIWVPLFPPPPTLQHPQNRIPLVSLRLSRLPLILRRVSLHGPFLRSYLHRPACSVRRDVLPSRRRSSGDR